MLVASAFTLVNSTASSQKPLTYYTFVSILSLSHYTLLPTVALYHSTARSLRRGRGRIMLWLLLAILEILTLTLWVMIFAKSGAFEAHYVENIYEYHDPDMQLPWDQWCDDFTGTFAIWVAVLVLLVLLAMVLLPIALVLLRRGGKQISTTRDRKVIIALCLATMWTFQIRFNMYRNDMNTYAGTSNKDSEWSFGQILGLVS
jgi:hypothetical protein